MNQPRNTQAGHNKPTIQTTARQVVDAAKQLFYGVWTREEMNLLKDTVCKGATDAEFHVFMQTAASLKLNPFGRQIFCTPRWDSKLGRNVYTSQISIDGFRLIAERTGQYGGQLGPYYSTGETVYNPASKVYEMVWYDAWPFKEAPAMAKVGVLRKDFLEPMWGQAKFESYAQTGKNGLSPLWVKMPDLMLAKCAESLALRKAFPNELSGHYTVDEMGQADNANTLANNYVPQAQVQAQQVAAAIAAPPPPELTVAERMLGAFDLLYRQHHNNEACSVLRYSIEDFIGKSIDEFDDGDIEQLRSVHKELKETGGAAWNDFLSNGSEQRHDDQPVPVTDTRAAVIDALLTDEQTSAPGAWAPSDDRDLADL